MWESLSWLFGGNLADRRGRDFLLCWGGEGEEWGKFGTGGRVEGWLGDGGRKNERLGNGWTKFLVDLGNGIKTVFFIKGGCRKSFGVEEFVW